MKLAKNPITTAEIAAQREAIKESLKILEQQEASIREQEKARVVETITSFPEALGRILGRKLSLQDTIVMLRDQVRGKINLGNGQTVVRRYRSPLSEDEKTRLKAKLAARQAIVDAGQTPTQSISQISREFNTTDATVNKWKAEWGLTRARATV